MPASEVKRGGEHEREERKRGGRGLGTEDHQLTHGTLFVFRRASPIHAFLEPATSAAFLVRRHLRLLCCLRSAPSHLPFIPTWGCVSPAHFQNSKPINVAFVSSTANRDTRYSTSVRLNGCTTLACGLSSENRKGQGEERVSENLLRNV